MKIVTKQVSIKKTIKCEEIESILRQFGEPLRWAIVDLTDEMLIIDGVFII